MTSRPLVLIHGWGGSSRYFADVMADLSASFWCLAPDLPGFGDSPPIDSSLEQAGTERERAAALLDHYSHRGLARAVAELLDAIGVRSYDVIGHSFGSGVAIALAAMQSERVGRVVLSNFSTFRDERERRMIVAMHGMTGMITKLRSVRIAHGDGFARLLGRRFFHHPPDDIEVLRSGLEDFWRMDPEAAELTVRGSLSWETPDDLMSLRQPVLLIHSRQDQIMPPRNAEHTAALARNGRLVWLDDCGHLPMIERRSEFVRITRTFLLGGDAQAAR